MDAEPDVRSALPNRHSILVPGPYHAKKHKQAERVNEHSRSNRLGEIRQRTQHAVHQQIEQQRRPNKALSERMDGRHQQRRAKNRSGTETRAFQRALKVAAKSSRSEE